MLGLSKWLLVKNLPAMQEIQVQSLSLEDPLRRKWQLTPVFLPGKFHGQRSLAGYSPRGHKESDTSERLNNNNNCILGSGLVPREIIVSRNSQKVSASQRRSHTQLYLMVCPLHLTHTKIVFYLSSQPAS